jgi:molybdate transport system ATP-binding protein
VIAGLPEQFGTPVLYVSHQLDEIVQIASTLIAIRDGRILGHGPVATMIETMDPAITGRFEAGSLLQGPVLETRPDYAMAAIQIAGARLWMPATGALQPGEILRIRIRARDVSLARAPIEGLSIRNQIPATVMGIETDNSAFAEVRLDCAGQALRSRISRMAVDDLELKPGMPVTALIKSISFDRRLNRG